MDTAKPCHLKRRDRFSQAEHVQANVQAADIDLDAALLERIDEILDPVVERDPSLIAATSEE
jgi:hypothetical protein